MFWTGLWRLEGVGTDDKDTRGDRRTGGTRQSDTVHERVSSRVWDPKVVFLEVREGPVDTCRDP